MKDIVKSNLVDALLSGNEVNVFEAGLMRYMYSTPVYRELFSWEEKHSRSAYPDTTQKSITLKQALALVDAHWDRRMKRDVTMVFPITTENAPTL